MFNNSYLEDKVSINFSKVKLWMLIPPFILLLLFAFYLLFFCAGDNFIDKYIYFQKDLFFSMNHKLSEFPVLQFNLTQIGDALISFSLLSIFLVFAPKLWEALLTSGLLSLIVSASLKRIFSVPRPAAMFEHDRFAIIGRTLSGNTSFPSGHSIVTFLVITILLFSFMPEKKVNKIFYFVFMLIFGLFIALSRVGVGAHYPFDVVIGGIIGYIVAVVGILIVNNYKWLSWIKNKKYNPFFILLFIVGVYIIGTKIYSLNLVIFYLAITVLIISLFLMINSYVQKN